MQTSTTTNRWLSHFDRNFWNVRHIATAIGIAVSAVAIGVTATTLFISDETAPVASQPAVTTSRATSHTFGDDEDNLYLPGPTYAPIPAVNNRLLELNLLPEAPPVIVNYRLLDLNVLPGDDAIGLPPTGVDGEPY